MKLFEPDNHSPDQVELSAVAAEVQQKIEELLKESFPHLFEGVRGIDVESLGGPNINSLNYRISGKYYLKFLPEKKAGFPPRYYPLISRHLVNCGFRSAGFYTLKGNGGVEFGSTSATGLFTEGHYFFLQDFISRDLYSGTKAEFIEALNLIQSLESVFTADSGWQDFRVFGKSSPYQGVDIQAEWGKAKDLLKSRGAGDDVFLNSTIDVFPELIESFFKRFGKQALAIGEQEEGILHSDLHPHNLLRDKEGHLWVIDHESFRSMPQAVYRGFSIFKLGRKSLSKLHLSPGEIKEILSDRFTGEEIAGLKFGAQLELIRRIILILDLHYQQGDSRWNSDLKKHTAGLMECDTIFS